MTFVDSGSVRGRVFYVIQSVEDQPVFFWRYLLSLYIKTLSGITGHWDSPTHQSAIWPSWGGRQQSPGSRQPFILPFWNTKNFAVSTLAHHSLLPSWSVKYRQQSFLPSWTIYFCWKFLSSWTMLSALPRKRSSKSKSILNLYQSICVVLDQQSPSLNFFLVLDQHALTLEKNLYFAFSKLFTNQQQNKLLLCKKISLHSTFSKSLPANKNRAWPTTCSCFRKNSKTPALYQQTLTLEKKLLIPKKSSNFSKPFTGNNNYAQACQHHSERNETKNSANRQELAKKQVFQFFGISTLPIPHQLPTITFDPRELQQRVICRWKALGPPHTMQVKRTPTSGNSPRSNGFTKITTLDQPDPTKVAANQLYSYQGTASLPQSCT